MTQAAPLAVVFDLDDTLYLERDYVRSGFDAVGEWVEQRFGRAGFAGTAWSLFEAGRRGRIFDEALALLGVEPDEVTVAKLVHVYRHHEPRITLADDAQRWLDPRANQGWRGLITDGPIASQTRKAQALALSRLGFSTCVFTDEWGIDYRKPHARAYQHIASLTGLPPEAHVYVADNALKDFVTPRRLGWRTVQLQRAGGLHQAPPPDADHAPERVITTLDEL